MPKIFMPYYCEDMIRLGKDNDGGYLVNEKDVKNSICLLSFGIGADISFEEQFIKQNELCNIIAYDSTIVNEHDNFFVGKNELHKENIGRNNIKNVIDNRESIFLKCDIDGSEYEILHDLLESAHKFTGAVIEFHGISSYNNFNELTNFISKFDLRIIHIHINNYAYVIRQDGTFTPDVIELTFSSLKENTRIIKNVPLPHPLDMPNNPKDDEFRISF